MSALEHEIIEKFHQLDKDAQQRVKTLIEQETEKSNFDFAAWVRDIETMREQISADHGGTFPHIDAVTMLREIRDGEDDE